MGACEGKTRGKGTRKGTRPLGPSLPHSRGRGTTRADRPALFPFPLRATPFARKGGTGAHEGTPPRLSASPPPSPPSLLAPPGTRGTPPPLSPLAAPPHTRGDREGMPPPVPAFPIRTPPPASLPPWLRRPGVARGYAAGHLPSPFAAPPGTREKGAREGIRAEWGARGHAAPFAREGAHEAKPTPPPYVSRSGAGAVSVRPRSPRHSTT
ncbi:hypothetical protein EDB84DRAFT_1572767 [Lactarius hengduanensis]|nr:hypothetical protein EDB84DRAFT_1572767 [Lactarius hengduanensis]